MALVKRPLIHDDTAHQLRQAIASAEVIGGEFIQSSTDAENAIKLGTDGGLYVKDKKGSDLVSTDPDNVIKVNPDGTISLVPGDLITTDPDNIIKPGADGKLSVDPDDLISTDPDNALQPGADGKLFVDKVEAGDLISADQNNDIALGGDNKLFLNVNDKLVIAPDDKILDNAPGVGLSATVKLTYTASTGTLRLTGKGNTAIASITLPKYSFIENAEIVVDPDDQPAGTYLKFTCRTTGNKEQVLYVDVTKLVDIYIPADASVDITDYQVKVVPDPSGPVIVNTRGVTLNQSRLISANANNILKRGTDGKLFVDGAAITPVGGRDAMTVTSIDTMPADLEDGGLLVRVH